VSEGEKKLFCGLPDLPMSLEHQRLVLAGRKTSTLRSTQFNTGPYRMLARGGVSLGRCSLTLDACPEYHKAINWLTVPNPARLARTEGYDSVAEFEEFMRGGARCLGRSFVEGRRALYLHWIEPLEAQRAYGGVR